MAIGELSEFHRSHGCYAEDVHIDTATLPNGWHDRLVGWTVESSRPSLRTGLLDVGVIRARVLMLPKQTDPRIGLRIQAWLDYYDAGKRCP